MSNGHSSADPPAQLTKSTLADGHGISGNLVIDASDAAGSMECCCTSREGRSLLGATDRFRSFRCRHHRQRLGESLDMQAWEYIYVTGPLDELNALGSQGWEAVGLAANGPLATILLKRPVSEPKKPPGRIITFEGGSPNRAP